MSRTCTVSSEPQPGVARCDTAAIPSPTLSRWPLILEARAWRAGMRFGMMLHRLAAPRPPRPSFRKRITTTLSPRKGKIDLVFYTPRGFVKGAPGPDGQLWPCVINFHGGGFCLGNPEDDARWAAAVTKKSRCVVVSVGYRRAPEHPFPTAVEDGADAMLWLIDHAEELGLDADRFATSGFSAGANMALTATLRLEDALLRRSGSSTPTKAHRSAIKQVICWYPPLDYRQCREARIASCSRPDKTLPAFFTKLFDSSYLHPPRDIVLDSPYLSPGIAPDTLLGLLPHELLLYTCRWDMLCAEGECFRERMKKLGKSVAGRTIENVAHAWDRSPNPLWQDKIMVQVYDEACAEIRRVLNVPDVVCRDASRKPCVRSASVKSAKSARSPSSSPGSSETKLKRRSLLPDDSPQRPHALHSASKLDVGHAVEGAV